MDEFGSLTVFTILSRLLLSAVIGGLIGYERQLRHKAIGDGTFSLLLTSSSHNLVQEGDNTMTRLHYLLVICFVMLLTACSPTTTTANTPAPIASPVSVGTAVVSTVEPVFATSLPLEQITPVTPVLPTLTPIPSLPSGLGPTELKYRILAQFPDLFFCDPDYYPIARDDELNLAQQHFPELQANTEEFSTILAHHNLTDLTTFTDEQKLLIYREHKKLAAISFELTATGYQFQLQVAQTEGDGEIIIGFIDGQGTITVEQRNPSIATCPICLAADTLIDTPAGPISVQQLRAGMLVWTMNKAGVRVALPLIRVSRTAVPPTHEVVYLVLSDGRELQVSPGHPTAEGRPIGQLQVGDSFDGAVILAARPIPYMNYATYDLLPAGETGFYWANGILIGTTLKN